MCKHIVGGNKKCHNIATSTAAITLRANRPLSIPHIELDEHTKAFLCRVLSGTLVQKKNMYGTAGVHLPRGHYHCMASRLAAGSPQGYDCPNLCKFKLDSASAIFVNSFGLFYVFLRINYSIIFVTFSTFRNKSKDSSREQCRDRQELSFCIVCRVPHSHHASP